MKAYVFSGMFAMTVGALLAGCVAPVGSDSVDVLETQPVRRTMGGGTSGGTNGLGDEDYSASEHSLLAAMHGPAVKDLGHDVHPDIAADLLQSQAGIHVFDYAVQCGMDRDYEVYNGPYQKFVGMGHMSTTEHWRVEGLDMDAQNDLLSCMVAHINPFGIHVPILLAGLNVEDDGIEHTEFDIPEAMWVTRRNVDGTPQYVVWPSEVMVKQCHNDPFESLKDRVCGQNPSACKLVKGHDEDCEWDEGLEGWMCLGKPALLTTLKEKDFNNFYADCH